MTKHLGSGINLFDQAYGIGFRWPDECNSSLNVAYITPEGAKTALREANLFPAHVRSEYKALVQELVSNGWMIGRWTITFCGTEAIFGFEDEKIAVWAELWSPW